MLVALPALAAPRCEEPYAPELGDTANATKPQIATMRDDVKTFIAASDIYQTCLAKLSKTDLAFAPQALRLIAANQRNKERIGKAFNAVLGSMKLTPQELVSN
jgi:hypothetical protein